MEIVWGSSAGGSEIQAPDKGDWKMKARVIMKMIPLLMLVARIIALTAMMTHFWHVDLMIGDDTCR